MAKKSQKRYERKSNVKPPRKRFLIVCEGVETEPNYFKSFQTIGRDTKTVHIDIIGAGAVGITVVKEAKKRKEQDGDYAEDEVWCVFDRDGKKEKNNQQNFNEAIRLAIENQLNLAISNDAFELWYLLHYEYYESETHRSNLKVILSSPKRLGEKYEKNSEDTAVSPLMRYNLIPPTPLNKGGFDRPPLNKGGFDRPPLNKGG